MHNWLDEPTLEHFARGLAAAVARPVIVFDADGRRLAAAAPSIPTGGAITDALDRLPRPLTLAPIDRTGKAQRIGWLEHQARRYIVGPVRVHQRTAGYVVLADAPAPEAAPPDTADLPVRPRDRSPVGTATPPACHCDRRTLRTLRWAVRLLADLCAGEQRFQSLAREFALLGDIGALLSGESDLQALLERIVRDTSRVMKCRYASLRLYDPDTDELRIAAAYNLSRRYADRRVILRSENRIDDEALNGKLVYIEDAQRDMRIPFREEVASLHIRSGLTTGLIYRGRPIGVLRVYSDQRRRFTRPQRQLLRAIASQAATAIVNAQLFQEHMHAVELERQLALAGSVQNRMIRSEPPQAPGIQTSMVFAPSSHVSGDFCDILTLADGRLAAVVGDVVGHGAPAALLMASIRGALRATAESCADLATILQRLNRHVFRETTSSEFATLLLVGVDPRTRRLQYANAGHEPLMLLRHGDVFQPEHTNLVLGVDADESFDVRDLPLRPDDFVLLYTDGTVEAMNFTGQLFGRRRLIRLLRRYGTQHPDPALRSIHWDIRRFVGLADQSDDLTLVGLRIRPAPPA